MPAPLLKLALILPESAVEGVCPKSHAVLKFHSGYPALLPLLIKLPKLQPVNWYRLPTFVLSLSFSDSDTLTLTL